MSPLGPIRQKEMWYRDRNDNWDSHGTIYLDELGNEYSSLSHLIKCAIAKELGL